MSFNQPPEKGFLRFAILCNGTEFQHWQAKAIRRLLESGHQPVLLITPEQTQVRKSFGSKLLEKKRRTLLYSFLENRLFKPDARATESLSGLLANIPVLTCRITRKGFSEYFHADDITSIKEAGADFILRFGFGIIRGDILKSARYGVWSFHHDDEEHYRGGPAGFWEIYFRDPVNGAILQQLTEKLDGGIVLKKGYLKTVSHSYREHIHKLLMVSAEWPAEVADFLLRNPGYEFPVSRTGAPVFKLPGNFRMIIFLFRLFGNRIRFIWNDLFRAEQWNIAIISKPIGECLLNEWPVRTADVSWFPPLPSDRYLADPAGFYFRDQIFLLAEDFNYHTNRAAIAMWRITPGEGRLPELTTCPVTFDHHVSYPFIFEHDGAVYMMPESWQSGGISLYRFDSQSGAFQLHRPLIRDVQAVDPTLFFHEGRWWLFHTIREHSNTHLYGWWADSLDEPFRPHACNPVKVDIRSARPAGTPFHLNGNLYRPAQDCSHTYGGRVALNHVDVLTPEHFSETTVKYIEPLKDCRYNRGLHTVSRVGDTTLIDGKRYVFSVPNLIDRLLARFQEKGKRHV